MIAIFESGYRRTCIRFAVSLLIPLCCLPHSAVAMPATASPEAQVDSYLAGQMRKLRIPGLAVAIVKDGHVVLARHYGTASIEFGQPVRDDTVFAINSVTKAFTGVAAMRPISL